MRVSALLASLSYGELRHLYAGGDGSGSLSTSETDRVIHLANRALTEIYTRLAYKRTYVKFQTVLGKTTYAIRKIHALSDTDPSNLAMRFILDSADEPFSGEIVKIRSVRQMNDPADVSFEPVFRSLNDEMPGSIKTLTFDTLLIPDTAPYTIFEAELQMNHPRLSLPADPDQEIELAPFLEGALAAKISEGVFRSMSGEEGPAMAQQQKLLFEEAMLQVQADDLTQQTTTDDFRKSEFFGWV